MADISVRLPPAGTPLNDPAWQEMLIDIYERSGGQSDKVETASTTADSAQVAAINAQFSADAAQGTANSAQASVASNAADIADIRFVLGAL